MGAKVLLLSVYCALLAVAVVGQDAASSCFTDPSQSVCSSFELDIEDATTELNAICPEVSDANGEKVVGGWPTACAMWGACKSDSTSEGLCSPVQLLLNACNIDSGLEGCEKFSNLCGEGSIVPACSPSEKFPVIPTAQDMYKATVNMCTEMPDMVGCETCKEIKSEDDRKECPNPLQSISTVCLGMWMTGCEVWVDFCKATKDESAYLSFCTESSSSNKESSTEEAMPMDDASMTQASSVSSNDACVTNPTNSECQSYVMPEAQVSADLDQLCYSMPNMVGCSLRTACENGTATGDWCHSFRLLGTICEEMSSMKGCSNYNSLCFTPGSVVQECSTEKPIPNAPSTEEARNAVIEMCADHPMVGCDTCTSQRNCPHPLESLSEICIGMPDMAGCSKFFSMCEATGESFSELCGSDDYQGLPPMRMWIHAGITDIVLIKEWVPRNGAQYFGTLVACFFGALLVQALKAWRIQQELEWASKRPLLPCRNSTCGGRVDDKSDEERTSDMGACASALNPTRPKYRRYSETVKQKLKENFGWVLFTKSQFRRNILRSMFTGIVVFLDYMLMLIVMTFNIGIIAAVVFGYMIGALFLGHIGEKAGSVTGTGGTLDPDNDVDVRFMEPPSCCGSAGIL